MRLTPSAPVAAPGIKLFTTDKPVFEFLTFTFEDAECLLNAAEPEWRVLSLLVLKTGLRHGADMGMHLAR
ncbi:hypothetical protein [Melittangium boletus]|uniref:hypothetical protein n=1 Tax=Melittangium boletus TaxID=83453 RepID=UPI003DA5429B